MENQVALIRNQVAQHKDWHEDWSEQGRMELAQCYEDFNEKHDKCLTVETRFPRNTRLSCGIHSGAAWLGETE